MTLGKDFAECPKKDTRQKCLRRHFFYRVRFAECHTRQTLCRVQKGLCRVYSTLGKQGQSGSDITNLQLLLLHILAIYTMQDHGICKQGSIDYRLIITGCRVTAVAVDGGPCMHVIPRCTESPAGYIRPYVRVDR